MNKPLLPFMKREKILDFFVQFSYNQEKQFTFHEQTLETGNLFQMG